MDYRFTAKRVIKRIASPILDSCGVYDAMLSRRVFNQSGWLILMYHRVIDDAADDPFSLGMCVDQRIFTEQIEYNLRHFTPIGLDEAVNLVNAGKSLPRNAVSITFDDGYLDFKNIALPVLKRYDCPATVFVTTGGLEQRRPFWWDRVVDAVARTDHDEIDIGFMLGDNPGQNTLSLRKSQRRRSLQLLQELLWEQPAEHVEHQVDKLRDLLGVGADEPLAAPRMDHQDIELISREGIEIGAHCEQHVDLRSLSKDECLHELRSSRETLQQLTGQSVNGFAYPGGRQNSEIQKLVAHSGYTYATSTERGMNRQPYDRYSLRRLGAPDSGVSDYKRCLAMGVGSATTPVRFASVQWP